MNGGRFDAMAMVLVASGSRRQVVRALAGLGLGVVVGPLAVGRGRKAGAVCQPGEACACKRDGKPCAADAQCCSGVCNRRSGKCICLTGGKPCAADANCCSGVCNRRTGTCVSKAIGEICAVDGACASGRCDEVDAAGCGAGGKQCCLALNATCASDCECCGAEHGGETGCFLVDGANRCCLRAGSGGCGPGKPCCGSAVCKNSVVGSYCCLPAGETCSFNDQCCGTLACINGVCKECAGSADACSEDAECCGSKVCVNGSCTCLKIGKNCSYDAQCCGSAVCFLGTCAKCRQDGQSCEYSNQCCGDRACRDGICG
jgi:hypothetical protein